MPKPQIRFRKVDCNMKISRHVVFALLSVVILFVAHRQVAARDEWIQVKSKNFFLVGNASEKDIRKVGTRLEQFRETFRLLFGKMNLTSAIPTNVVVFKSDSSFKNFKPKKADGKIDNFVAGFFQPGEDVNYISLSAEGDGSGDSSTKFSVIFHEYVHFIVNTNFGKSDVPPWFNEGLAEYYETFAIENDQKIKLGLPQSRHLTLLQDSKLVPLDTLFKIGNSQLLNTGDHSRSIFYAESWALMHYLIQGGKSDALSKFLKLLLDGNGPEKAFQDSFQMTYAQMEGELRKYVSKSSYNYHIYDLKNKLTFDADMQTSPLDEADTNAYLGDLLYHSNRSDDAEPFLLTAIKLKPASSMANTALGMVKMRQRKFDEAKTYLETAIAGDQKNHIAFYRYGFLLSRDGRDEFGFVRSFSKETADKIRDALNKAIALNPAFTESYELLAFVNMVNNERLDESVALLQKALRYQPGNQRYALRLAEIYLRQNKLVEATTISQKIATTTDDAETRSRANNLLSSISQKKEFDERQAAERKRYEAGTAEDKRYTDASLAADSSEENLLTINSALRKTAPDEKRVIGAIQKIDCKMRPLVYTVKTPTETFTLTTNDFDTLLLNAFTPEANKAQVGCDENLAAYTAVITYKPLAVLKSTSRGELVAVEFVQGDFRFTDADKPRLISTRRGTILTASSASVLSDPAKLNSADAEARRREMMMRSMAEALRKPAAGEKREIGYLDKIECSNKAIVFVIRTTAKTFRLLNTSPQTLRIGVFTPDLAEMQFGCSIKPIEVPAVFVYTDKPDGKSKTDGEIVSLEFVPKTFVLEP